MTDDALFDRIWDRVARAETLGWVFEDSRLTPGCPVMGVRTPRGEAAGLVPSLGWKGKEHLVMAELDRVGVPDFIPEDN